VIDKEALVAHIRAKADHPNLLIHAVLAGLVTAIERGDFDTTKGGQSDARN
jgi:hypothetical protein